MKKIFKGMLLSLLLISSSASLSGCFGFGDEAMEISNITTVTLENGDIQVIITYVDEDTKPTTFVVPKGDSGEDGKDGNGIKEITSSQSEDGLNTLVNITFTQDNVDPIEVKVPNGVSIIDMKCPYNEEKGMCELTVYFSDRSTFGPIEVPKGEKGDKGEDGKDGISIIDISTAINRDLSVTVTIILSEGEPFTFDIPAPQKGEDGEDGREISNIDAEFNEEKDAYEFTVTYTDESETIFDVARQNKWFTEDRKPDDTKDGKDGDIWYDVTNQVIYIKENKQWKEAINFEILQQESYTVRFELNDSKKEPGEMPNTILKYEEFDELEKGTCFASERITVPVPTREGYEFIGWYATKDKLNPTHGAFTDMTPIMSDLTLYARWVKIEDGELDVPTEEPSQEPTTEPSEEPSVEPSVEEN